MTEPVSAFVAEVRARIAAAGQCRNSGAPLLQVLAAVHAQAEDLLHNCAEGDRGLIACHAGCSYCCVVNVSVSLLEGLSIVRFLRRWSPDRQERILAALDRLWTQVRGLDDEERLALRKQCAFLDESGRCSIYPVRPLYCRSISSTDPETCRAAVTGKLLGIVQPILMHRAQQQVYESLFMAVAAGLEQAGLDGRGFQLSGLIRYLLRQPLPETALLTAETLTWERLYG